MSQEEKSLKREVQEERKASKKRIRTILLGAVLMISISGISWWVIAAPKNNTSAAEENIVLSRTGLHWHPTLSITIKGEEIPIPANIGLSGAIHNPIHTHDPDGVIHLEFSGRVRESDTVLSKFFDAWGKDFSKLSLLGNKTGEGGMVKMYVNGKENTEFENYKMKHEDKIELVFE